MNKNKILSIEPIQTVKLGSRQCVHYRMGNGEIVCAHCENIILPNVDRAHYIGSVIQCKRCGAYNSIEPE